MSPAPTSAGLHRTVWLRAWPDDRARSAYEAEADRRGFSRPILADGQSAIECELLAIRLADLLDLRDAGVCDRIGFDPAARVEVHSYTPGFDHLVDAFAADLATTLDGATT